MFMTFLIRDFTIVVKSCHVNTSSFFKQSMNQTTYDNELILTLQILYYNSYLQTSYFSNDVLTFFLKFKIFLLIYNLFKDLFFSLRKT